MAKIYLLLGSNLGKRMEYLKKAIEEIEVRIGKVVKLSSIYETEPWGFDHNNFFLNQVIQVSTLHKPHELLNYTLSIEKDMGRSGNYKKYEARIIDIDVLFYEQIIVNTKNLIIPHPKIQNRMFILKPMSELSKDYIHPVLNKSIELIKNECVDKLIVRKVAEIIK